MSISRARLEAALREVAEAVKPAVERIFGKRVGFTLFLFTYGDRGSVAYLSTAQRDDMIATVKQWLAFQEAGITTESPGPRGEA